MSGSSRLDAFRTAYIHSTEAMNRGDFQAAFGWMRPGFEWWPPHGAVPDLPLVMRGPEEVSKFLGSWLEDFAWRVQPLEFSEEPNGDIVVRLLGSSAGRHSGLEFRTWFTQIWEFDEAGAPVRVREHVDDTGIEILRRMTSMLGRGRRDLEMP